MGIPTSEEIAQMAVLNGRIRTAKDRLRYYTSATAGGVEQKTEHEKRTAEEELRELTEAIANR